MRRSPLTPPLSFAFLLLALSIPAPAWAVTYNWIAVGTADMGVATNWSPARTVPAADDRLVFAGGGTITVNVPTSSTIGQFVVSNSTQLRLAGAGAAFGGRQLTVGGGTGPDLQIGAGSGVTIIGDKAVSFRVKLGATAEISGQYTIDSNPLFTIFHQLIGESAEAIQVLAGGVFETRVGQGSNPFDTSLGPDTPNMARFHAGSLYIHGSGLMPPVGDVVFDAGSTYRHVDETAPSLIGRTFANFEYDSPLAEIASGTGDFTMDSLTVRQGQLGIETVGVAHVRGSIQTLPGTFLGLGSVLSTLNLRLEGSAPQRIVHLNNAGLSSINLASGLRLIVANPSGVRLDLAFIGGSFQIPGGIEFQSGVLACPNSGVDVKDGSLVGASAATGWFDGYMILNIRPDNPTCTLPFGTQTMFAPSTITLHGLTGLARVGGGFEEQLPEIWFQGSQLDATKRLPNGQEHYLTVQRDTTWSSFDANFRFEPAAGSDPLQYVARLRTYYNEQGWRPLTTGTRTATSLQVLGVTRNPGDLHFYFAIGEPSVVGVSAGAASIAEGGSALKTPSLAASGATLSFPVTLSEPAVETITVDYATAAGSATAGADFDPQSGTLTFLPGDTVEVVNVPLIGEGVPESNETLSLVLSNAAGAVIVQGEATGTILDDDDVEAPTVSVVYPNGGETIIEGATVDLLWTASDNVGVVSVDLRLSVDDGANWQTIADSLPNTGSYSWTAPSGLTQQARLEVIARDHRPLSSTDVSDAVWSIWGVDGVEPAAPVAFGFELASANPSRGAASFRLALSRSQRVRVAVHDVRGRLVAVPLDGEKPAGVHRVDWTGTAPAGIYYVRVEGEEGTAVRRIARLR